MKKLVLYSGQDGIENLGLDEALLGFLGNKQVKFGYIPSCSDPAKKYFHITTQYYQKFCKLSDDGFVYFDLDQEYDESRIEELLTCDVIHLSGGNTYYFLNSLKQRKFIPIIQNYVASGGILTGVSAGSMLMSKTIGATTVDTDIGGDQNEIRLKDFSALDLVDFDFFPHFDGNEEILKRLKKYSAEHRNLVYACRDGNGIVVQDEDIRPVGDLVKIQNGKIVN